MADYATVNDVEVALGYQENTFDTSSQPTLTRVSREIDQVTKEIDFYLSAGGITTQPTNGNIVARLRNLCVAGVVCKIGMAVFGNNDGVDDSQPGHYCESYQAGITEIKENTELYGSITGDDTMYISNQVTDGTISKSNQDRQFLPTDYKV